MLLVSVGTVLRVNLIKDKFKNIQTKSFYTNWSQLCFSLTSTIGNNFKFKKRYMFIVM